MDETFHARAPVAGSQFDLIIIGGGVNGVAIARECASSGKRILLLEQNDFASGTSSRSTRIIHGGLRYLEHGELGLVRESLRERDFLLRSKPNLVRSKQFLLALPANRKKLSLRNPLAVRAGLILYRQLSGRKRLPDAENDIASLKRSLDSGQTWSIFDYEDAQCEFPERLIADWAAEAAAAGVTLRNHTQVLSIVAFDGCVTGVFARDLLTQEESQYHAKLIINATGPWVDSVCASSNLVNKRLIQGVRGSHIILPKFPGSPNSAIYVEANDKRTVFVIPWNSQILVGTTEVPDDTNPSRCRPSAQEIEYLLSSFHRAFPGIRFNANDIIASFSGIRALPFQPHRNASAITRQHFIREHIDDRAKGLFSIIGGKLTTATSLARECAQTIGFGPTRPLTYVLSPAESATGTGNLDRWIEDILLEQRGKQWPLSKAALRKIAEWHGAAAPSIVKSTVASDALSQPLCPHTEHVIAEAVHAVKNEFAVTLGDVLLRRVPVALSACWSYECSQTAARSIGTALGWPQHSIDTALENFESEREDFLGKNP